MGLLPPYSVMGIGSPILLVFLRALQGIGFGEHAGIETGVVWPARSPLLAPSAFLFLINRWRVCWGHSSRI